jgi:hypothetical protein
MATIHTCDRCGAEVASRDEFWIVELQPAKVKRGVNDRKYLRMELCEKCKKQVYYSLHEPKGV